VSSFTVVARVNYRKILEEEAARNGVRVFYHNKGAQWGRAALGSKRIFVPKPARFPSFFTGLHELGHLMSGHRAGDGKPEYLWEYEAFSCALEFCKKKGILVPKKTIDNERNILAEKIRRETDTGVKQVDPAVVKFVKEGDDEDPDVEYVKKFIDDDGTVLVASD
jgi:hypothetical protein